MTLPYWRSIRFYWNLFTLFSYMNDGLAYAAEALTGRFIGACNAGALRKSIRGCLFLGLWASRSSSLVYISVRWQGLLGLFVSDTENATHIIGMAGRYIIWIILIPLACTMPFIMDGIMVGATETRIMRNSMFLATAAYFAIYYEFYRFIGNNALWLAFTLSCSCAV